MKIKRMLILLLIGMLIVVGCRPHQKSTAEEIRATWISYIDYTQILWGKSETEYRQNVDEMIDNLKELKINTIYVHASAFTDAYYPSEVYPTAKYITGKIGDELSFDPFGILVEKAKAAGIQVEAWINPLRSFTAEQMAEVPSEAIQKQWISSGSRNIVYYNDRWYLNPAYDEVHETILALVKELVGRYEIDGIHMDDYFYPDGVDASFDAIEYEVLGNGRTLAQFRKDNVNKLVEEISETIHTLDKNCRFTISPAGNIQYTTETIYGDVAVWIKEEWIDQVIPQIYFGYEHETLPFDECLAQWEALVKGTGVTLIPGLAAYKINTVDSYAKSGSEEWITGERILAQQIEDSRKAINYGGFALFSYYSIFYPDEENAVKVSQEIESVKEALE